MRVSVCVRHRYCVSEADCLGGDACVFYQTLSCSLQHLTTLHLLLLLDQPRAAVTSPFPVLTSHAHTCSLAHTQPGRPLAHEPCEDVLVGEHGLCSVSPGRGGGASGTILHLKSWCEYANWMADTNGESE